MSHLDHSISTNKESRIVDLLINDPNIVLCRPQLIYYCLGNQAATIVRPHSTVELLQALSSARLQGRSSFSYSGDYADSLGFGATPKIMNVRRAQLLRDLLGGKLSSLRKSHIRVGIHAHHRGLWAQGSMRIGHVLGHVHVISDHCYYFFYLLSGSMEPGSL